MKLYATVSSERASKGQGGNEYIDIDISGEKREYLARFVLMVNDDETSGKKYLLTRDWACGNGNIEVRNKGERQKGECVECKATATLGDYCRECAKDIPL